MNEKMEIQNLSGGFNVRLELPGSKSVTNRALVLAALSHGRTTLQNFSTSDDSRYLAGAFQTLGLKTVINEKNSECVIEGGTLPQGARGLFVGNAGTAMRFLLSYLTLGHGEFILDGDERMRERPIRDLIEALNRIGCDVESVNANGCPPVKVRANGMPGGKCEISGKSSSQYVSSILMSAPLSERGLDLVITDGLASEPYLEMTLKMMEQFGVSAQRTGTQQFHIPKAEYRTPRKYYIEPDASSASYFLTAAAILNGTVAIKGIGADSLQGDARFADALGRMGCEILMKKDSVRVRAGGKLKGIDIDMNSMPDMVPSLAVAALFAEGPTRIRNVANLRIKESDRISALTAELARLGAKVKEWDDGFDIFPNPPYNKCLVFTYNDHRIAMAFSVAGLRIPGIEIENPSCVSKSFPEFYSFLRKLS